MTWASLRQGFASGVVAQRRAWRAMLRVIGGLYGAWQLVIALVLVAAVVARFAVWVLMSLPAGLGQEPQRTVLQAGLLAVIATCFGAGLTFFIEHAKARMAWQNELMKFRLEVVRKLAVRARAMDVAASTLWAAFDEKRRNQALNVDREVSEFRRARLGVAPESDEALIVPDDVATALERLSEAFDNFVAEGEKRAIGADDVVIQPVIGALEELRIGLRHACAIKGDPTETAVLELRR